MALLRTRIAVLLVSFVLALVSVAAAEARPEYELKIGFLYNFAKFVEWPEESKSPFVIGVLGKDRFNGELARKVRGRSVRGRPFEVRYFADLDDLGACDLLFVGREFGGNVKLLVERLEGTRTLTVGDDPEYLDEGLMIVFAIDDRRVRFDVDLPALKREGLKASAQLLQVARERRGASKELRR